MELPGFLLEAIVISLSGVMAPGPMSAAAVGHGSRSPYAGSLIAVGHALFEVPLALALSYGFGYLRHFDFVKPAIGLVGGAMLLVMGIGMLRGIRGQEVRGTGDARSPVLVGALLSAANPYFLVWWLTVGAALVLRADGFGPVGFPSLMAAHWLCDLVWFSFLGILAFRGGRFFGRRFQQVVFAVCGAFLLYLSAHFMTGALGYLL